MSDVLEPGLLVQRAVYWPPTGEDPETGAAGYGEPVEIRCRWVDQNTLFTKPNTELGVSRCQVMVDRDLEIGGVLNLGTLEDVTDLDEPLKNPGANIIQGWTKIPDDRAKKFVREAIC
jgi:hypothetical protein